MSASNKDRIEFAAIIGRETIATTADIMQILRNAKRHGNLAETMCNRELTSKEMKLLETLEAGFKTWAERVGCVGVVTSRDPRGCTVKLKVKSGKTNDWGQEGICVPQ